MKLAFTNTYILFTLTVVHNLFFKKFLAVVMNGVMEMLHPYVPAYTNVRKRTQDTKHL